MTATPPAGPAARRMPRRASAVLSIYLAVAVGFGLLRGLHVMR
jgi:hypothetical protein